MQVRQAVKPLIRRIVSQLVKLNLGGLRVHVVFHVTLSVKKPVNSALLSSISVVLSVLAFSRSFALVTECYARNWMFHMFYSL